MSDIDRTERTDTTATAVDGGPTTRETIVEKEKAEFGGFKFGSAFFGWLTATGTFVILTTVVAAIGAAVGVGEEAGVAAAVIAGIVLLIAYYCGGYVAGRMARFSGIKQGIAVWLWAIVVAIVLTIVGFIAGTQTDVLANLNSITLNTSELTVGSIITAAIALVVSLIGAILGGLAGMRFHRRVDRAGLGR
jgi:ABC-type multidrug transport system permease subunit